MFRFFCAKCLKASHTICGPKSEPPIPILTMSVKGLPLYPCMTPCLIPSLYNCMLFFTSSIFSITDSSCITIVSFFSALKAVCNTSLDSVLLNIDPIYTCLNKESM